MPHRFGRSSRGRTPARAALAAWIEPDAADGRGLRIAIALAMLLAGVTVLAGAAVGILPPGVALTKIVPRGDALVHAALYGAMALAANTILPGPRLRGWRLAGLVVLVGSGLEELAQAWDPVRSCDPIDFAANAFGVVTLGSLAPGGRGWRWVRRGWMVWRRARRRRSAAAATAPARTKAASPPEGGDAAVCITRASTR